MDIKALSEPLYNARFWMKLVAVIMIIYGVIAALSIVGLLIAWLPVWMGVVLFQAAGQAERAHLAENDQALLTALAKLKTYFTITGVLTAIGLIVGLLGFLFGLGSSLMMPELTGQ